MSEVEEMKTALEKVSDALYRAAEHVYKSEMVDTNMEVLEIREVAEKYQYYKDEEEKKHAIENCSWATKDEWIYSVIDMWMNSEE